MSENANLYAVLHRGFSRDLNALAVETPGGATFNYRELDAAAGRYVAALAGYKVLKRMFVVEELPRNAMGKVQKNLLRERFS